MAHASHSTSTTPGNGRPPEAQPITRQRSREMQPYGTLACRLLALGDDVRAASIEALNQILCDTIVLRDMYKKHHWQVSGPTFYALHLLFDKHAGEQAGAHRPSWPSASRRLGGVVDRHGPRRRRDDVD